MSSINNEVEQDLYELPLVWKWVALGDICNPINGRAFKSSEWRDSGVPIIRIQNLKSADAAFNYFQGDLDVKHKVVTGDLLFAWSGTPGTSFGAHIWHGPAAALNQHIFNVKFDQGVIDPKYFCYALNQNVTRYVEQAQGGVGLAHITKSKFMASKIPLAPLEQQKRIVAEIEKQFSRLDEAVANLKRVKANLKRYKAAVLKAAVEGKLTEEWRKQHPDVEPADKLLERILAERREKWQGRGKYKEPAAPDTTDLPKLPEGWAWIEFQLVADVVDPQPSHRTPEKVEGGVPYVGIGDIDKEGNINFDAARKVSPDVLEEHRERYHLKDGDFIFGKIGTIGRPISLTKPYDYTLSANVVLMQPHPAYLHPELAFLYMASPMLDKIIRKESRATTQAAFGIKKIRVIPFPLPPLLEQKEIVKEAARLLSVLDVLCEEVEAGLRRSEHLRQSILKEAFSGQLIADTTIANVEVVNV